MATKRKTYSLTVKNWGDDRINLLAVVLEALNQMKPHEQAATIGYLNGTYKDVLVAHQ